jgi:tetraacyldisaccharide 4'-kinase
MNSAASLIFPSLSALYSAATQARLAAYRRGIFPVAKLDNPVVSVGNITTGGTGKSPLVEYVCRAVAREGKRVCILTRGYGRAYPSVQVIVSDGSKVLAGAADAGDEPLMLANSLKGIAAVISNSDRLSAGMWAIENLGSEVFVLDDGFQHLRLFRDLNIVIVDATNPWGGNHLLPSGRLREPLSGLARADCVVITRSEQCDDLAPLKADIESLSCGRPIIVSRMKTLRLRRIDGLEVRLAGHMHSDGAKDKPISVAEPVGAFCGVGNPQSFFNHLRRERYELAFTRAFPDHHNYTQTDLDSLTNQSAAHGAKSLITSAKDSVKLSSFLLEIPCFVLDIAISIDEEESFVEMIRKAASTQTS